MRCGIWALVIGWCGVAMAADLVAERADHWHQWRGPEATGVGPQADPPMEWDQTKNLKWKAAIPGAGKASPIVWGHRVFVATAVNTGTVVEGATKPEDQPMRQFGIKFPNTLYRYVVQCLDRDTGKLLWEKTAVEALPHEGHHGDNSFASASPTTDGQFLYVSFGSRGLYCYTLDGELQWQHKLNDVTTRLSFGEASSPVIHGDTLVFVRDNETDSRILALDARTGDTRWEAKREEGSAWATPLVTEFAGQTQVITNASKKVRSYDLKTGDVIWECGGQVGNVTPCPVRLGDNVICMSGYRGSIALSLPLSAKGDISGGTEILWKYDRDTPYVPSPLLYGDLLYFNKLNNGVLTVLDATTGKPVIEATRLQGISNVYASPVAAAGRVYFTSRDGTTIVLKQGPQLEVLATNRIDDLVDSSPALVGRQILIRGQKDLYCFENR
jgi:outer membrane protein assembly factor BamB